MATRTLDLLSPNKFVISIDKFQDIQYFAQDVTIPSVSLQSVNVPTNTYIDAYATGDKMRFDDLQISFLINKDLAGWRDIVSWMVQASTQTGEYLTDITISVLDNNMNENKMVKFYSCSPTFISGIKFSAAESEFQNQPMGSVTFKYTHYEYV